MRKSNPRTARQAVLEYLKTNGGNIADASRMFGINRPVVYDIPNYQWSAMDVTSRFKLIGYSWEKSWTNGLCWYLWVISWLRKHGVSAQMLFTIDNGEEFGGKSWLKINDLRKLISGFGCRLTQNHKRTPRGERPP